MINSIDDAKCWPEDYKHENGMYICRCINCRDIFYGYKRRVICKLCDADIMDKKLGLDNV